MRLPGPGLPAGHDPRRGRRRVRAGERRRTRRTDLAGGRRGAGGGRLPLRPRPRRPRRSPAGRSSGWCSPARSPGAPACSCSTSRPPSSTPTARRWCAPPSPAPSPTARRLCSSSTTTPSPGCPSSTGSWSCSRPAALVEHGPRLGARARCGSPVAGHSRPGSCCWPPSGAGFTHRGERGRRRCGPPTPRCAPAARWPSPARTARASPPSRCCSPGCARRRPGGSTAVAGAHRRAAPAGPPAAPLAGRRAGRSGSAPSSSTPSTSSSPAGCATSSRWARCAPAPATRRRTGSADELLERLGLARARRRQPVHALRRPAAAAVGGDRAGHPPARAGARRAHLRAGPRHLGASWWRCSPSSRTAAARSCLVTHDAAVVAALADDVLAPGCRGRPVGMSLPLALGPARPVPLSAINPVAQLTAIAVVTVVLLVSADLVTPAVVLAAELSPPPGGRADRAAGAFWRAPGRSCSARPGSPGSTSLFGAHDGAEAGWPAATWRLRVVALALPGVLLVASHRPGAARRRADHPLAGVGPLRLRRTGRAAAGAAAGHRVARRSGWPAAPGASMPAATPSRRPRLFAGTAFALLVGAVRRGSRLATAMDARGLRLRDPAHQRPRARRLHRRDAAFVDRRRRWSAPPPSPSAC